MATRSSISNNTPSTIDYHRGVRGVMQVHLGNTTGRQEHHGYPLGHSQAGPYPLHMPGVPGGIDVRQRESGPAGAFLHSGGVSGGGGGGGGGSAGNVAVRGAAVGNMGMMSATTSTIPTAREGYADVAVARQCEREGCNVQPSYGKVWKKVSE